LGNIITLRHGLDTYGADGLRLFILNGHYRSPLTYSEEALAAAKAGSDRLLGAIEVDLPEGDGEFDVDTARQTFIDALADDLGTPQALAVLFNLAREINRARDENRPAEKTRELLRELGGVLGLQFKAIDSRADAFPFIELLIEIRKELREKREFDLADRIRDRLAEMRVALEDGPESTSWKTLPPATDSTAGQDDEERPLSKVESTLRF